MQLRATDALLLIDLQLDFMPGGTLEIAQGDAVLPVINRLAARFDHVLCTQDWHPARHISFASAHPGFNPYTNFAAAYGPQTLWPDHCVQASSGAALHPALAATHAELLLRKGFRRELDSYSAFVENDHTTTTGLACYLRERGLTRLFVAGLAYDFCVRFSAIDGKAAGFEMLVIEDACRAVDLPGSVDETNHALAAAAIPRVGSGELLQ
jgi:nicotinamidase/pyrazinamidase